MYILYIFSYQCFTFFRRSISAVVSTRGPSRSFYRLCRSGRQLNTDNTRKLWPVWLPPMTAPWSTLVSVRCAGCGTRRRFTGTVLHANIFFYHLSEPHFVCYVINFTFAIWNVGDHKVTRREHLSEHKKSHA